MFQVILELSMPSGDFVTLKDIAFWTVQDHHGAPKLLLPSTWETKQLSAAFTFHRNHSYGHMSLNSLSVIPMSRRIDRNVPYGTSFPL